MESTSVPGRIQCTRRTADLIQAQDPAASKLVRRGEVEIKVWAAPVAAQPNSLRGVLRAAARGTRARPGSSYWQMQHSRKQNRDPLRCAAQSL